MNNYLKEDFDSILSQDIDWEALRGKQVLVTGATGLIGSLFVKLFCYANETKGFGIQIYPFVRNEEKAKGIFGELWTDPYVHPVIGDLTRPITVTDAIDFIIHGAAVTTSKVMVEHPVETIDASLFSTKNVLEFAKEKNVSAMVYLSSMEMYGSFAGLPNEGEPVTEEMLGYIDGKNVRSNYPLSKRMCENMCVAYASEYNVPVKIARLAQTFGAGVLPGENRVFAQFAKSAMKKEDIVLHTKGRSEGNYCYTSDAMYGILKILQKGEVPESYNVCNEKSHTTIGDMAQMVAEEIAGGDIRLVFDIPEENLYGYPADTKLLLSSEKLRHLGWEPKVDLPEAYRRLIGFLGEA